MQAHNHLRQTALGWYGTFARLRSAGLRPNPTSSRPAKRSCNPFASSSLSSAYDLEPAGLKTHVHAFQHAHSLIMSDVADGPFPRPPPKLPSSVFEMLSMKGKVTVVTGGSGGIGTSVADALAEAGSDIALWYNTASGMDERAETLAKKYGVKVKSYKVSLTEWEAVEKGVAAVVADFGTVDCFIANAGTIGPGHIIDLTIDEWKKVNSTNYDSVFYCLKAIGPIFKKQGSGSFIATTSISAHIVNVPLDQPSYNSAKAGVMHLCKCVARDWRTFARVNTISPGYINTSMGAAPNVLAHLYEKAVMGRQGEPEELKGAFLFLASNASSYVTGADILVDGGYVLA